MEAYINSNVSIQTVYWYNIMHLSYSYCFQNVTQKNQLCPFMSTIRPCSALDKNMLHFVN